MRNLSLIPDVLLAATFAGRRRPQIDLAPVSLAPVARAALPIVRAWLAGGPPAPGAVLESDRRGRWLGVAQFRSRGSYDQREMSANELAPVIVGHRNCAIGRQVKKG